MAGRASTALVLQELGETLPTIDDGQIDCLVDELLVSGRRVLVTAVGRMLISLKAWVKRLKHLGVDINYVGDETEMPVRKHDLVLIGSSSGESRLPAEIARIAKERGADVFYIGCTSGSAIDALASERLMLRGRTKFAAPGEYASKQPMSTLVEQELFLLGDIVALEIMRRRGWTEKDVKDRHANLE
ncbi:SIS domain-containing protein [Olsenella sp. HMSC062G07]|uniref:SIS domain-containing protein n=1 Tax=Olsenella sp. HMSC062G07 TaxID=1739330 RepID=UPI0008A14A12|nr:SIS domain-containing protein [Olsenella sp. HMSC062G07]OFK23462.1 hypothetical protein HMPREF2826_05125 [Olsenella sp. HMSC062G07]